MSDNAAQASGTPTKAPSAWMRRLQIIVGLAGMAVFGLIIVARFMTAGDLPECDSSTAKDTLSNIFKSSNLEFSRYIEIKTLKSTKDEVTCFASLAKTSGGSAEFDYRIYFENKAPKLQITRGVDKP